MFDKEKDYLRNNKLTAASFMYLRTLRHKNRFITYDESRVIPIKMEMDSIRINLVLPVFYKSEVYGGISTAIKFFLGIVERLNCDSRIIVSGSQKYSKSQSYNVPDYEYNKNLLFISENNSISVGSKDIFICTSWSTAFYFFGVIKWQYEMYGKDCKLIYLIQDYEPGFFPWSTEYVLADSTYRHPLETVAVFNSEELYAYFMKLGYEYFLSTYFKPSLNEKLKSILLEKGRTPRKRNKTIIVYGRPIENRNAFGIIYRAIQIWDSKFEKASEWKVLALGDRFRSIKLKNCSISFLGKLPIEEYGEIMLSSYCGISLMISPHPSYPPLEMSTFGVKTITNSFETKNLSEFNDNIITIDNIDPVKVADKLINLCNEYKPDSCSCCISEEYINGNSFFDAVGFVCNEYLMKK